MWPAGVNAIGRVNGAHANTGREAFYEVVDGGTVSTVEVTSEGAGTALEQVTGFAQAAVLVAAVGLGFVSGGADALVNVAPEGGGKPSVGSTAVVNVVATGDGVSTGSTSGGTVSTINVAPEGAGTVFYTPSGGTEAIVAVDPLGVGSPGGGSTPVVSVAATAAGTPMGTQGGVATVNVSPQGAGDPFLFQQGAGEALVQVFSSGGGNAHEVFSRGRTSFVEISAEGRGAELFQGVPDATGVNAHRVNGAWVNTGYSVGGVLPTGGATAGVEVSAEGGGMATVTDATEGRTAFVEVVSEGAGQDRALESGGSTATIEVSATGLGQQPQEGTTAIVSVEATGAGIVESHAPGRIIFVAPKFREIAVLPKGRLIPVEPRQPIVVAAKSRTVQFPGDDEGLNMEVKTKQPTEIVDYDVDLREWFSDLGADFVPDESKVTVTIDGPDNALELGSSQTPDVVVTNDGKIVKVWTSGGTDGATYMVTVVVNTNIGRREKVDFLVEVEEQTNE